MVNVYLCRMPRLEQHSLTPRRDTDIRHGRRQSATKSRSTPTRQEFLTANPGRGRPGATRCFCKELAHPTGFEPVTFAFGGRHSIQLSYGCVRRVGSRFRCVDTLFDLSRQTPQSFGNSRARHLGGAARGRPMAEKTDVRPGELAIELPGLLSTPASISSAASARRSNPATTARRIPPSRTPSAASSSIRAMRRALPDLGLYSHVWLLYWMDQARRDLMLQVPAYLGRPRGTFALRSPVRPNPIALAAVEILGIEGATLARARRRLRRRHAAARHQALFRFHRLLSRRQAAVSPVWAFAARQGGENPVGACGEAG